LTEISAGKGRIAHPFIATWPWRRLWPDLGLLSPCSLFLPCSQGMTQTPPADAVPVCIATPMADVSTIEPDQPRATSARSASSGAMDAVARMSETIHLSQPGPTLRADACLPGGRVAISRRT